MRAAYLGKLEANMGGDDRIHRMELKLDKVGDELGEIKVILAAQHETLKEHHRRSEANEKSLAILNEERIRTRTRDRVILGILTLLASSEFLIQLLAKFLK